MIGIQDVFAESGDWAGLTAEAWDLGGTDRSGGDGAGGGEKPA